MSKSQQLIEIIVYKLHAQLLLFLFQLFRSADKIDEDDALVHLVHTSHTYSFTTGPPPPHPCGIGLCLLCNKIGAECHHCNEIWKETHFSIIFFISAVKHLGAKM
jgi:hypothetical protein